MELQTDNNLAVALLSKYILEVGFQNEQDTSSLFEV